MKKHSRFLDSLLDILLTLPRLFGLVSKITSLIEYEAYVAKRSIVSLCVLLVVSIALLSGTWICILGVLLLYFLSLKITLLSALLILLVINLFMLIILAVLALQAKNRVTFPATRHLIRHSFRE